MSPRLSTGSLSALQELEHELTRGLRERRAGSRQQFRGLLVVLTVVTLGAVVMGVVPARGAVRFYLVVVVAMGAVIASVGALSRFGRLERWRGRSRRHALGNSLPPFFERAQRRLELASTSNAHFEQLRPQLCEVARTRLAGHGARLDSEVAHEMLGDEAWTLLMHSRSGDKFDPGPQPNELRELFDALERI